MEKCLAYKLLIARIEGRIAGYSLSKTRNMGTKLEDEINAKIDVLESILNSERGSK